MILLRTVLATVLILVSSLAMNSTPGNFNDVLTNKKENTTVAVETSKTTVKSDLKPFLDKLGMIESGGNYQAINRYGYLGKYQFSKRTLKGLGFDVTPEEFLADSTMQDSAAVAYLRYNRRILRKFVDEYEGKTVRGIKISKGGILAGAHLTGAGGVMEFFQRKGKYKTKDGNGVDVSTYIQRFSSYQLAEI